MNYGKFMNHPRSIRYLNNHTLHGNNRWSVDRNRDHSGHENRSRSSYRSHSPQYSRSPSSIRVNVEHHGRNPRSQNQRFCYGCGSPDHIIRNKKCTPSLSSIKMNLVSTMECNDFHTKTLAEDLLTLHVYSRRPEDSNSTALKRNELATLELNHRHAQSKVHFGESVYNVREKEILESQIRSGFVEDQVDIAFVSSPVESRNIFDCSHAHLTHVSTPSDPPAFFFDIGTPRSVIGHHHLNHILRHVKKKTIPKHSSANSYRFGDVVVKSLGTIEVALGNPPGIP